MQRFLAGHNPSAFLLAAQFLQLLLYTLFEGNHGPRALLSGVGALVLVMVVWVVVRSPGTNWIAWALAVPAFLLSVLSAIFADPALVAWSAVLESILYFYAAGSLIAYMLEDFTVTTDELFAAGATLRCWPGALPMPTWSARPGCPTASSTAGIRGSH